MKINKCIKTLLIASFIITLSNTKTINAKL